MHISDLHFHRLPRNPAAYLSKRLLGGLNLALSRHKQFPIERVQALVKRLDEMAWDYLVITGDLTQLGTEREFALAHQTLAPLLARGPERVIVMPGNHDRYVREVPGAGAFEHHFGAFAPVDGVGFHQLDATWHLAAWDSAAPAPWFSAAGRVPSHVLDATAEWMGTLPNQAKVIVANHYPVFFYRGFHYIASHDLKNQIQVRKWLRTHPVSLYLHGHIHRNWVLPVKGTDPPMTVVNSAASAQLRRAGAKVSDFHRITLAGGQAHIEGLKISG